MKLSEALRKSIEMGIPCGAVGIYYDNWRKQYCALGAAYVVAGVLSMNTESFYSVPMSPGDPTNPFREAFNTRLPSGETVFNTVTRMNDDGASREDIATYLERYGL